MVLPRTADGMKGWVRNDGLLVSPSGVRMPVGERLANEARRVWVRGERCRRKRRGGVCWCGIVERAKVERKERRC